MKFYIGSGFKNSNLVNYYSEKLESLGLEHTYNWAKNIKETETKEDMINFSRLEIEAILNADLVIILLPAGRGTHVELGMALALNKRIFLCADTSEVFDSTNTVNFYEIPEITKLVGCANQNIARIIESVKVK